jgi:RNA polymerase sigma-B factor
MRRHREGDRRARVALIERYIPLARTLAMRYRRSTEPVDDLVQVACLGLVKAVDRWEPVRGLAFSTYAVPTILGELRRYFRDQTWAVRPPRDLIDLTLTIERAREPLGAVIGREPTADDLAVHLDRSRGTIDAALRAVWCRWPASLEDGGEAARLGGDDRRYEEVEGRATFEHLTSMLDARAREVLRLRFERDLTQLEIARRLGSSQIGVSRILRAAFETITAHVRDATPDSPVPAPAGS